jgi:Ca2+-binding EF-hand superfamily protein
VKPGCLNPEESKFFVSKLLELLNLSRKLESAKMELAQCRDFNLMDAFSIFDEHGQGFCTQADFRMILTNLGLRVNPDHKNILAVFKRYNKSKDGLLKYSEFMAAVCPNS